MRNTPSTHQNQTGKLFREARLRLHRALGRTTPISREALAEMALKQYGPIEAKPICRRSLEAPPEPQARWVAKIRALERRPGLRSLKAEPTRQLCELLDIKVVEEESLQLDLRKIA